MIGFVPPSQFLEWLYQLFGMPKIAYYHGQSPQQFVLLEFHIGVHKQGLHLGELLEESIIKDLCKCFLLWKNPPEALFEEDYL
jgi:hypothetical protein